MISHPDSSYPVRRLQKCFLCVYFITRTLILTILLDPCCWSFNGLEPGGPESKREKEADIPWFTRKVNRALFLGCKTQNSGLRSKEEKPRDPINQPSRCNTQEGLLTVAQTG